MPAQQEHIDQASHNHQFWNSFDIDQTPYSDWVIVGMFYEAVHWIEAYLAQLEIHSRNHHERQARMASLPDLSKYPDLIADYNLLRIESENARYWAYRHSAAEIRDDLIPAITRLRSTILELVPS